MRRTRFYFLKWLVLDERVRDLSLSATKDTQRRWKNFVNTKKRRERKKWTETVRKIGFFYSFLFLKWSVSAFYCKSWNLKLPISCFCYVKRLQIVSASFGLTLEVLHTKWIYIDRSKQLLQHTQNNSIFFFKSYRWWCAWNTVFVVA